MTPACCFDTVGGEQRGAPSRENKESVPEINGGPRKVPPKDERDSPRKLRIAQAMLSFFGYGEEEENPEAREVTKEEPKEEMPIPAIYSCTCMDASALQEPTMDAEYEEAKMDLETILDQKVEEKMIGDLEPEKEDEILEEMVEETKEELQTDLIALLKSEPSTGAQKIAEAAVEKETKKKLVEAGAIPGLVDILKTECRSDALKALSRLAADSKKNQTAIIEAGAVSEILTSVKDEDALVLLYILADPGKKKNLKNAKAILDTASKNSFLPVIAALEDKKVNDLQRPAAALISRLAPAEERPLGPFGPAIPALVAILDDKLQSDDTKDAAKAALTAFVHTKQPKIRDTLTKALNVHISSFSCCSIPPQDAMLNAIDAKYNPGNKASQ